MTSTWLCRGSLGKEIKSLLIVTPNNARSMQKLEEIRLQRTVSVGYVERKMKTSTIQDFDEPSIDNLH